MHLAVRDDSALEKIPEADRETILQLRETFITPNLVPGSVRYDELFLEVNDSKKHRFTDIGEDGKEIVEETTLLTSGTADFVLICGENALLLDWKFGSREVSPAQENTQTIGYAVGIFQKFSQVNTIYARIVQPVFWNDLDTDGKGETVFKRDSLPDMIAEIAGIADRAELADESSANCTEDNCRYCNKNNCRIYQNKMTEAIRLYGLCDSDTAEISIPKEEAVAYSDAMLVRAGIIKSMVAEREAIFKKMILESGGSEHYRIQSGRVTKKTDWSAICREYQVAPEDIVKFTTETTGDPYVIARMRKPKKESKQLENNK